MSIRTAVGTRTAVMVAIPIDLAQSVALAISRSADMYRRDTGHSPDGIASLNRDADRLDQIADSIERELVECEP